MDLTHYLARLTLLKAQLKSRTAAPIVATKPKLELPHQITFCEAHGRFNAPAKKVLAVALAVAALAFIDATYQPSNAWPVPAGPSLLADYDLDNGEELFSAIDQA